MRYYLICFFISLTIKVLAQVPVIHNISIQSGSFNTILEITGGSFNATPAANRVMFGSMEGTVLDASETFIKVSVPSGAVLSAIAVTNTTTGLTAYSSDVFYPTFNGDIGTPTYLKKTFADNFELWDLAAVDLDKDGKNDVITTKYTQNATDLSVNDISVYHNTSTWSDINFTLLNKSTNAELNLNTPSYNLAYGDIDGDGLEDIVVGQEGDNQNNIYVLKNISTPGSIKFAIKKTYILESLFRTKQIAIKDLNGDGKPEITITNSKSNNIAVFENNSSIGTINLNFTPLYFTADGPNTLNGLTVEDLNNDGKPDIALTQFGNDHVFVLKNTSAAGIISFDTAQKLELTGNIINIKAADIDGDSKNDLVVSNPFDNIIEVFLNTTATDGGNISFGTPTEFSSGTSPWGFTLGDFVGNGTLDIMVSSSNSNLVTFYENKSTPGNLVLEKKTDINIGAKSRFMVMADFNGDSKTDVAMTSLLLSGEGQLVTLKNNVCLKPVINNNNDVLICNSQVLNLSANKAPGITYIWKKDDVEIKNSTEAFYASSGDGTEAGDYTLVANSMDGCSITSEIITVTVNNGSIPNDPVASNNGPVCIGSPLTLTSSDVTGATFEWVGPNGFTSTEQNPTILDVSAGTYSVTAIISPCRSATVSTVVEVIQPPDFSIGASGSTTFCEGSSVTLSVTNNIEYSYQWLKDGVAIPGAKKNSYVATTSGSYDTQIDAISSSCSVSTDPIAVSTFPPPVASFTTTQACVGDEITFTSTSTIESGLIATYSWNFGDGTGSSSEENPLYTYSTEGVFAVKLIVGYSGHSCLHEVINDITINIPTPVTIITNGFNPFCEGDSTTLKVDNVNIDSYAWSTGETTSSIIVDEADTYSVTATNSAGCVSTAQTVINTLALPVIVASAEKDTITIGENTKLLGEGGIAFEWTPGETLSDSTIADPVATPTVTTTYVLQIQGENGCFSMDTVTVAVGSGDGRLPITTPKLFSPNGDGIDDYWVIGNIENFPSCKMIIFTRNGNTVYEKSPYINDWNGTSMLNGGELPTGAYFYALTCEDGRSATGSISIIR